MALARQKLRPNAEQARGDTRPLLVCVGGEVRDHAGIERQDADVCIDDMTLASIQW